MKKIILIIIVLFLVTETIYSQKQYAYQTECVSTSNEGYFTIKIWNTKKGKRYKNEQARKDAIHSVLFSGFMGSSNCTASNPLLKKDSEISNFKKIETSFFKKNGTWVKFVRMSETETTIPSTVGEKNWKIYYVVISKNLLRKYLTEHKIINSLNNGF